MIFLSIGCPFRTFVLIQARYTSCDGQGANVLSINTHNPILYFATVLYLLYHFNFWKFVTFYLTNYLT